jgi:hypothetical protein
MTTPSHGRWQVTTETSVYLIDLDARWIIRVPDAGAGRAPGMTPTALASLRPDHERIDLIHLHPCEIGRPMKLLLQI